MKKIVALVLSFVCLMAFNACGIERKGVDVNTSESVSEEKVLKITTPYADLCLPETFDGVVANKVISKEPYTVSFYAIADKTELFSLVFDGSGDILMGTLVADEKNTVIYMNIPKLDSSNKNYDTYCGYQEAVNTIMTHMASDYTYKINELVEDGDTSTFDIETSVVTMKYPNKWKDKVQVKVSDEGVKFSNDGTPLFDLNFIECDGYLLGTYKNTPIYVVDYTLKTDEQMAMQEDINVILQNLMSDSNFVINN